jgi:glycosyltransferase involved in cell wall biosynthesis
MNILITAPNLDTKNNVSGISTVVLNIIEHCPHHFRHFELGSKDKRLFLPVWLLRQLYIFIKFPFAMRHTNLVHINTAFNSLSICRDFVLILLAKIAGKKIVMHIHGGKYLMQDCHHLTLNFLINNSLKLSNAIIVLSDIEKDKINKLLKNGKPIYSLSNCIDFESIHYERTPKSGDHPVKIIFLGRIHESKGIEDIEEGIKKLNNWTKDFTFSLYGAGPLKDSFINRMHKILDGRFDYKGVVQGEAKWKALSESDILLQPSRYGEGLPMSMLEAMAAGNVVVVTDDASITTVVRGNINGMIVNKKDPQNICNTLFELIKNQEKIKFISKNAMKTIHDHYNLANYIPELEKIYSRL